MEEARKFSADASTSQQGHVQRTLRVHYLNIATFKLVVYFRLINLPNRMDYVREKRLCMRTRGRKNDQTQK